jgi:hypothetical protein
MWGCDAGQTRALLHTIVQTTTGTWFPRSAWLCVSRLRVRNRCKHCRLCAAALVGASRADDASATEALRKLGALIFNDNKMMTVEESLDAVDVLGAFVLHGDQLAMQLSTILVRHFRHPHHAPHLLLPGVVTQKHAHQLGGIETVALGPPFPPIDLDGSGIDDDVGDALAGEPGGWANQTLQQTGSVAQRYSCCFAR